MRDQIIAACNCCGIKSTESEFNTNGDHPIFGSYVKARASDVHVCDPCKVELKAAADEVVERMTSNLVTI